MLVPIETISPDPNQPRKIFDEEHIKGLATSLQVEGMINEIEVDSNMMIITGECRWRAAKFLNWLQVPIRINQGSYSEYERLRHQMAENVHQSGTKESTPMNSMDVARAYAKLLELKTGKDSRGPRLSHQEMYGVIKEIAQEIGVSTDTIQVYLGLLDQPEFVQKDIEKGRPKTFYIEANRAPVEFQPELKKQIAQGQLENGREIRELIIVSKKLPELAAKERQRIKESKNTNRILNGVVRLGLALEVAPLEQINLSEQGIIKSHLEWLKQKIEEYLDK